MGLENNRHLLIIDPAAGDDFIGRRIDAIARLRARIRKKISLRDQLSFAGNLIRALSDRSLDEPTRKLTAESVTAAAPAFVDDGSKDNELSVVFALACAEAIDVTSGAASEVQMQFLARALKLGLSYLAPFSDERLERLRTALIDHAAGKLDTSAEGERQRQPVPRLTSENYFATISILASNAKWDREEIDLLWWVINDWSNIADRRVSSMSSAAAAVISALETSALFAGPAAEGHRNIAMRHIQNVTEIRSPQDFATQSAEARPWARHALGTALGDIAQYRAIVPGLAIATLSDEDTAPGLPSPLGAGVNMSLANWCRRLVDEIELLKRLNHNLSLKPAA